MKDKVMQYNKKIRYVPLMISYLILAPWLSTFILKRAINN